MFTIIKSIYGLKTSIKDASNAKKTKHRTLDLDASNVIKLENFNIIPMSNNPK